jgi:hypothetical protein
MRRCWPRREIQSQDAHPVEATRLSAVALVALEERRTSRRSAPPRIYRLQVSRYLRQLPSPSSPNSSLWRHESRNSLHSCREDRPRRWSAPTRTPPGPTSIPGTTTSCENVEEGKAQRAAAAMPSANTRIKILPMSDISPDDSLAVAKIVTFYGFWQCQVAISCSRSTLTGSRSKSCAFITPHNAGRTFSEPIEWRAWLRKRPLSMIK